MQILGLGKVRIMRFSGRKGELGGVLSGSDPDARDKEERQWARLVRATMREKWTEGKGGKGEEREERRRRPIRQSWRMQRAGGERRGGKERTMVSS